MNNIENTNNNSKINKLVKIDLKISFILLIIYFIMVINRNINYDLSKNLLFYLLSLLPLMFYFIGLLIGLLLVIVNFNTTKDKNIITKIIITIITSIFILFISILLNYNFKKVEQVKLMTISSNVFKQLNGKNNSIIFYNKLKNIDSSATSLKQNSYIVYRDILKPYICFEYKNTVVYGYENNLHYSNFKSCNLDVTSKKNEYGLSKYVNEIIKNKYNIEVTKVVAYIKGEKQFCIDSDCINYSGQIDHYEAYINEKLVYTIYLKYENNQISFDLTNHI